MNWCFSHMFLEKNSKVFSQIGQIKVERRDDAQPCVNIFSKVVLLILANWPDASTWQWTGVSRTCSSSRRTPCCPGSQTTLPRNHPEHLSKKVDKSNNSKKHSKTWDFRHLAVIKALKTDLDMQVLGGEREIWGKFPRKRLQTHCGGLVGRFGQGGEKDL